MTNQNSTTASDAQPCSLYHTEQNILIVREMMRQYLPLFAQCRSVLDIGCGPGVFLELLREQNGNRELVGIDNDPVMVSQTAAKGFTVHGLRAQDIGSLHNRKFTGIHAGHVIEHMPGPEALVFLTNCFSLLSPGGILLLKTPNWEHPYVRHNGFWLDITHVRPYPPQLLEKVLADIGFSTIKVFAEKTGLQDIVAIGTKAP